LIRGALLILIGAGLMSCTQGAEPRQAYANSVSPGSGGTTIKVKDPVCGMVTDPEEARWTAAFQDLTFAFCSPECLDKFKGDPSTYSARRPPK
jgi:YHS domain-containing protein